MFAERLKTLRLEAKLTQKEISNKLGISQPTYQRYEKSEREPNQEMLQKISSLFNVTIDYLFGNTDNRNTSNIDDDLEKSLNTFKAFDGKPMSDHDRELIREMLKEMFDEEKWLNAKQSKKIDKWIRNKN